jgi:hypothetical protein
MAEALEQSDARCRPAAWDAVIRAALTIEPDCLHELRRGSRLIHMDSAVQQRSACITD